MKALLTFFADVPRMNFMNLTAGASQYIGGIFSPYSTGINAAIGATLYLLFAPPPAARDAAGAI
jgi:hypothetical protein